MHYEKKECMCIASVERRELMRIVLKEGRQLICIKEDNNEVENMKWKQWQRYVIVKGFK